MFHLSQLTCLSLRNGMRYTAKADQGGKNPLVTLCESTIHPTVQVELLCKCCFSRKCSSNVVFKEAEFDLAGFVFKRW